MMIQAMAEVAVMRLRRRGEYGFDGNMRGLLATVALTAASLVALTLEGFAGAAATAPVAAFLLAVLGVYVHTTRRGKFLVWAEILDSLRLRGDERVSTQAVAAARS